MLYKIQPLLNSSFQIGFTFIKIRHFKINVSQFIIKCFSVLIFKLYGVNYFAFFRFTFVIIKGKIKNSNAINSLQIVVPFASFGLFLDWKSRIINGSFFEIILLSFLQFYDKFFAFFIFAIDVVNGFSIKFSLS